MKARVRKLSVTAAFLIALGWTLAAVAATPNATLWAVQAVQGNQSESHQLYRYAVTPGDAALNLTFTDVSFDNPCCIAFSSIGEMYVVNRHVYASPGGSISRFRLAADTPTFKDTISSGDFANPHWIAFEGNEFFVANPGSLNGLLRFKLDKNQNATANGSISAGLAFSTPRGVTVTPWGELFVSQCCGANSIARYTFDASGNPVANGYIAGNGLDNPHDMVFSEWGELFVANLNGGSISRFNFDAVHNAIPNGGFGSVDFNGPIGLAFSPWGELFVSNHFTHGITRFVFSGSSFTVSQSGFIATPDALIDLAFVPLPTSTAQCVHDGWRNYGVFKNQGDCVSFVATQGKNPPGR